VPGAEILIDPVQLLGVRPVGLTCTERAAGVALD